MVANQRERLLDAVARVCVRRGYLAMTVADIVAEAGVSRRVFYGQHANKEDCFLAAYERLCRGLGATATRAFAQAGPDWPDRVTAGLAALLAALAAEPDEAQVVFVEVLAAGPRLLSCREGALLASRRLFAPPHTDAPVELVESVMGGAMEVIYQVILAGRARVLPDCLGDLVYGVVMPFLGHAAAETQRRAPRPQPLTVGDVPSTAPVASSAWAAT